MFVQAVEDVLGDDSFQLPSPLATVALKAATLLPTEVSCWNSLHWRCSKPDFFQIPPEGENMEVNLAGNGLHNSQQSVTPLQFKRVVFPSASISSSLQTWITAWILIRVVSSTLQWSMITCHKRNLVSKINEALKLQKMMTVQYGLIQPTMFSCKMIWWFFATLFQTVRKEYSSILG